MNITIRPLAAADEPFLWEMLYQALYVPEGAEPFPRDLVNRPELSHYVQNWGIPTDLGFIAIDESEGRPVGAVWIRLLTGENKGYGYVDDRTPELSIAVMPEYRARGIGTRLLVHLLNITNSCYADLEEFGCVWAGCARPNTPNLTPKCGTSVTQTRYRALSLSVSADNPAVRLYRRHGFETVETIGNSLIMLKRLGG